MKASFTASALLFCTLTSSAWSAEPLNFEEDSTRINYSLGFQIGGDFKRQGIEMDADAVVQGIRDALSGDKPKMSQPEMHATLRELKHKVVAEENAKRQKRETEIIAEGKKFREDNAKKEGVVTTASGLQYKMLDAGSGAQPGPTDQVTVNYRGMTIEGKEFDSSYKKGKPATFKLNSVIAGWGEGLQLMKEGGKAKFFIPPELAYRGRGPLAHMTLIFDVELISVEKAATEAKTEK